MIMGSIGGAITFTYTHAALHMLLELDLSNHQMIMGSDPKILDSKKE